MHVQVIAVEGKGDAMKRRCSSHFGMSFFLNLSPPSVPNIKGMAPVSHTV